MALIDLLGGGNADGDSNGSLFVALKDKVGNFLSKKQREKLTPNQEFLLIGGKNDDFATALRTDRKGNQMIGNYTPEFYEAFDSAIVNPKKWFPLSSTMTTSVSMASGLTLNSGNITTANAYFSYQTTRFFQKIPRVPLHFKSRLRHSMVSNAYLDFGFGIPATNAIIVPNGVYFRMTSSGQVQGVLSYNGVWLVQSVLAKSIEGSNVINAPLAMTALTANYYVYDIIIDDDNAIFTIQNSETGEMLGMLSLPVPAVAYKAWGASALPIYYRLVNGVVAPTEAPLVVVSELQVLSMDWNLGANVSQIAGSMHLSPIANSQTGATNTNMVNSTAAPAFTLSNTAPSSTALDGVGIITTVAGSDAVDYLIGGLQMVGGQRFMVEGVTINAVNVGTSIATTPVVFEWFLALGQQLTTLVGDVYRKRLGFQSFVVGDVAGKLSNTIDIRFPTPEVVENTRFVKLGLKIPFATAGQTIRVHYTIHGRYI